MSFLVIALALLLLFASIIMILLVLIQRGRGGGLAGAFGGMGGQSALGVRAGDIFTKITVVVAVVWVLVAGFLGIAMRSAAKASAEQTVLEGLASKDTDEDDAGLDGDAPATKMADDATAGDDTAGAFAPKVNDEKDSVTGAKTPPAASEDKPSSETATPEKPDPARPAENASESSDATDSSADSTESPADSGSPPNGSVPPEGTEGPPE